MRNILSIVKKISLLHSGNTETPTAYELACEIISKIPIDWSNPDICILDPACGRGTFLLAVIAKLQECGHSNTQIAKMIYGCDKNKIQWLIAKKALKLALGVEPNVYYDNSLTRIWDMKFDAVVGNPPFGESDEDGKRKSISTNLYNKFVDMSVNELVKEDGYVAMITPASWAGPTKNLSNGRSLLKDIMAKKNTLFINLSENIKTHFPSVSSTFSYYVIQNTDYNGQTAIQFDNQQSVNVDLRNYDSLPRINNQLAYSIVQKYQSKITGQVIAGQLQSKKIIKYNSKQNSEFTHLAYHTPADGGTFWYTNTPHPNEKDSKVIISLSGKYQPYADAGNIGFTDMCLAYIVKSNETLDSAYSVINSKMFHFIMKCNKWSGFNNKEVIRKFALPTLDHLYTDDEIYDWFGLTDIERKFVNENAN